MQRALVVVSNKDFKFVPFMFVTLGSGSQIPLSRAIFHGLGIQRYVSVSNNLVLWVWILGFRVWV